jgi:hypothetical protein
LGFQAGQIGTAATKTVQILTLSFAHVENALARVSDKQPGLEDCRGPFGFADW